MSLLRLALRNLKFHWRTNCAVALGVLAATAVLTGALVVGDSVRGSLRHLVLDRLGRIDSVLVTPGFFRDRLAGEVAADPDFQLHFAESLPAVMLQGTVESTGVEARRAGKVSVLGVGPQFWQLGAGGPQKPPARDEIVLNTPLADELHVRAGDEVMLRLPQAANVPADSPLGRKTENIRSRRFTVSDVIPAEGLGRFGIRPTQQLPLTAFTAPEPLQQMVGAGQRVNAILVAGRETEAASDIDAEKKLRDALRPTLADYGLSIARMDRGYFDLTSDRMLLEPAVVAAAMKCFQPYDAQSVFTYLANYILAADGKGKIPYSTVAALDFSAEPPLGPFVNRDGQPIAPLADGEIVLNAWAADDLAAQGAPVQPGDTIELTYFEPESTHGRIVESTHSFRLKGIVALEGAADDRNFTPEVKGVTDEPSIANWNPPFPYDPSRVRSVPPNDQDDQYWQRYRATPKAFVSLQQGRDLWASRFGDTTSIRISPAGGVSAESLAGALIQAIDPAALGFQFLPVKRLGLEAATGTTPFAVLFLMFSMFIIGAALLLVVLLVRLAIAQRATELGTELAIGLRTSRVRDLLLIEGTIVAAVGALAGAAAGLGYAWLMIAGLKTWWLGAISTPFLDLHVTPTSLAIGYGSGLIASLLAILLALRPLRRVSMRQLISGQMDDRVAVRSRGWARWIAAGLVIGAIATGVSAAGLSGDAQAGAFLGAGALVLAALMALVWDALRADRGVSLIGGGAALARLAIRNSGRFPLRSTLTIGLMATACFLIMAVSAFQLEAPGTPALGSGDGGFALIAQCDQPIYQDLNSPAARRELGFDNRTEQVLADAEMAGARIYPFRVQAGDDASCLNLYQPRQPRVLGVPPALIERGGFAWAAVDSANPAVAKNPWLALQEDTSRDPSLPVPVVLDQNTALYSLHLSGGVGEVFEIDRPQGGKIKLQVVGLLKNSIFQGELLMGEANFLGLFPDVSGYRLFLVATPAAAASAVADALEESLGDWGFDAQTTSARLAALFAVQNTYLATFRTLGGLGLLLGTFGVVAVQLRNVVERRGELALLRATGFRHSRLAQLVLLENACLMIGGLGAGTAAAAIALLPHLASGAAGMPWAALAATLAIVLAVGLLAGALAVRAAVRAPLIPALRGD